MSVKRILTIVLCALGLLLLLAVTVFLILRWAALPERLPAQFDGRGHITAYGGKSGLLGGLLVGWLGWLFLAGQAIFPRRAKTTGAIRYASVRLLPNKPARPIGPLSMALLALDFAFIFSYLTLCSALVRELGAWFLPVTLGVTAVFLFVPLFFEKS